MVSRIGNWTSNTTGGYELSLTLDGDYDDFIEGSLQLYLEILSDNSPSTEQS